VFDLDGTIVDTVADIAAAIDSALAPYNCRPTSNEDAAALMGEGLSGFFWRALVAKRLNLPADEAGVVYQRFIDAYRQSPVRHSRIYPGMKELLEELREAGVHTAVCTNKVEDIAIQILEQFHILGLLDAVVGHKGDRPKKPDPLTLLEAIALAGGSRERALMVGDTGNDSSAAIAAGIPAILLSYGYSPVQVGALSTDFHVDSVPELRDEIMRFLASGDRRAPSRAVRR
jgi:phosphoglycolate phosphatase